MKCDYPKLRQHYRRCEVCEREITAEDEAARSVDDEVVCKECLTEMFAKDFGLALEWVQGAELGNGRTFGECVFTTDSEEYGEVDCEVDDYIFARHAL